MDINVTIQAADLAEAICKLADAIDAKAVNIAETAEEVPETKKRTRRNSKSAHTQEGQAPAEQAVTQPTMPQPVQAVAPAPAQPVAPPTVMAAAPAPAPQQPGYWPQATADGKINQVQMPLFNGTPAPQYQPPVAPPVYAAPVQAPPLQTAAPSYTVEQLGVAAMPLMDANRQADLLQLLARFGVQSVQELPKERYAEFAMALRQLGAKI